MNISETGLDLIRRHEGLRLSAYQDSVGVWTIGYGHTGDVTPDAAITEHMADTLLSSDAQKCERCVNSCVNFSITQNQFDALCSFVFNLGCRALGDSTLLRKLNTGDVEGAAQEFTKWDHAGGVEVAGLLARRNDEMRLFLA